MRSVRAVREFYVCNDYSQLPWYVCMVIINHIIIFVDTRKFIMAWYGVWYGMVHFI